MPRYLRYPLLVLAIGAVIFFASDRDSGSRETARSAVTTSQPDYLITDAGIRPAR